MKKVFLMAIAAFALTMTSCGDKKTGANDAAADSTIVLDETVEATADSLTSELESQIEKNDTAAVQSTLATLQSKYAQLVSSGNLETAKAYAVKIQQFLNANAEKIKEVTAANPTVAALVSGIQSLPTSAEATAEDAAEAMKENAEGVVNSAKEQANEVVDQAKKEAEEVVDNAKKEVNEAKEKANQTLEKSAEKANEKVNEAKDKVRKGLGL